MLSNRLRKERGHPPRSPIVSSANQRRFAGDTCHTELVVLGERRSRAPSSRTFGTTYDFMANRHPRQPRASSTARHRPTTHEPCSTTT